MTDQLLQCDFKIGNTGSLNHVMMTPDGGDSKWEVKDGTASGDSAQYICQYDGKFFFHINGKLVFC